MNSSGNRICGKKKHLYHPEVTIGFNPTAYNTEVHFLRFFDKVLFPLLGISNSRNPLLQETFFHLDVFAGHSTDTVFSKLLSANIITSFTAVNKSFKEYYQVFTNQI